MFPLATPARTTLARIAGGLLAALALGFGASLSAQIPGRNVNMVSGVDWPGGDPFLQRQNEPSLAASSRNPLHLMAGSNDYRTVDLPGLPDGSETGDAWLGLYKSFDGGQRWSSTLLPGYPQDTSAAGLASPLKGYQAAADPVVRAGTSGLLYFNGLVFDRGDNGRSGIFVSRFIDRNNKENGDPIAYLGTSMVVSGTGSAFLDKPWMAVDIPRGNAPQCIVGPATAGGTVGRNGQRRPVRYPRPNPPGDGLDRVAAGAIYVTYSSITGDGATLRSAIFLKRSLDCGATWSQPLRVSRLADAINQGGTIAIDPRTGHVFVSWRRFASPTAPDADAVMVARLPFGGSAFDLPGRARAFRRSGPVSDILDRIFEHRRRRARVAEAAAISELDQGTSEFRFRTNAYPSTTVDGTGRLYVAWSERGFAALRPDPIEGDARILISTSTDGRTFTAPAAVDDIQQPGHQLMPSLTFAAGRLMLIYYDLRETSAQVFARFISDADSTNGKRHTIDIRAAMGAPGALPVFAPSTQVSDYLKGFRSSNSALERLQVNPPNLPMFRLGTVPFIGDYIDVAAAAAFVSQGGGRWAFNTVGTTEMPQFHAAWTDNRDVRPPLDGNWTNYAPPTRDPSQPPGTSVFDPTQTVAVCQAGNAGARNQNVYTARIGGGLLVGAPGNAKPLSQTLQRGFVVFAQNQTTGTRTFRMRVLAQPAGGRASFNQFPLPPYIGTSPAPLVAIDVRVPARSTASRTLFVTARDADASVLVDVSEVAAVGGGVVIGGLQGRVLLNPDIENPDIENPDIENPDIENPDIENAEVYNPDIENPDIENPDIENPDIENPDIENPDIENVVVANPDIENLNIGNPDIENPDIENPDIENPDIENPDIENGTISDVTWTVSNTGNTTAAFNVNLFLASTSVPAGLKTQLVLYKTYETPVTVANGCQLRVETRNVLIANVPNPRFITPNIAGVPDSNDPSEFNPTLWLAPGEVARVTLRVFDNDASNNVILTRPDGTTASIDPVFNPATQVTPGISAQGVDVLDPPGTVEPPIVTPTGSNLFFLQQPTTAAPNVAIAPAVGIRAFDNTGAALPGVVVTLALVVPGGATLGGNVAVSSVAGIATFPTLSVSLPGTYQLLATAASPGASASALSNTFEVALAATGWSATGTGITTVPDTGSTGTPQMTYEASPANGFPSFAGNWQFAAVADVTRALDLRFAWTGLHSYFMVTARLDVFVNRGGTDISVVTLVNEGPVSCSPCLPPSGGFGYGGTTTLAVQAGDTYGVRLYGTHGDSAQAFAGTLTLAIDAIASTSPATIAPGQMVVIRGAGMPATAATGVLFNQGGPDLPASYAFTAGSFVTIARSPTGLLPGPASVRLTNGISTLPPIALTLSAVPGAPLLTSLRASCGGAEISTVTPGLQVSVLADGVDTSNTSLVWTPTAGPALVTSSDFTTAGPGSVCTVATAPAGLTSGTWTLQIRALVGASTSPLSNTIAVTVP